MAQRHVVHIEPAGFDLELNHGVTLMSGAQAQGVRWPNVCGGAMDCGVCAVELVGASDQIAPPSVAEQHRLSLTALPMRRGGTLRLACQLQVTEAMTIVKPGVRKPA